MTKDEALRLALEALEDLQGGCTDSDDGTVDALTIWCPEVITALRKALEQEQPVQEPVAYYHPHKGFYWAKPTSIFSPTAVDVPPVPLYVKWKAAQRQWVGLELEEILDLFDRNNVYGSKWIEFARTVEAKLKELNT